MAIRIDGILQEARAKRLEMTCKIERVDSSENAVVLLVSGRIETQHVSTIKELIGGDESPVSLDLREVTLVDREVVPFLVICEGNGVQLANCPAFLRDWIAKERQRTQSRGEKR